MKMSLLPPLLTGLALVALAGCGNDADAPAPAQPTTDITATTAQPSADEAPGASSDRPASLSADVPEPASSSNRVTVGSTLAPDGAAMPGRNSFSVGDTLYASAPLGSVPPNASVSVYWTYEDGNSHKEETVQAPTGEEYVVFEFSEADGMQPGSYNAQIDVDMQPVGIAEFRVE